MTAKQMSLTKLEELFAVAKSNGYARPVLRMGSLKFKEAPPTGANPGAIYVTTSGGAYLGKIHRGQIIVNTSMVNFQEVQACAMNPQEELIKYGHKHGYCGACGRRLDNASSVHNGIGPICAEKLGFPLATPPAESVDLSVL